jgi:glycosyltransferase involved in cell wall biosynthesis
MSSVIRPHTVATEIAARVEQSYPRIALVAASLDIVGGQGVQADILSALLRTDGYPVEFIPINPRFPRGLRWLRKIPYLRTILNQLLYFPSLFRMRGADVAHIYSASYWSFLLTVVPAILAGRWFAKRVVLNYHSGEAHEHLAKWGMLVHPWLRWVDEIVVPSRYLQRVFAYHGYPSRVIENVVDTSCFVYRDRAPLGMRLLSTRNLDPYYRVDVIIEAFALIKQRYPGATLTIAGAGSEERRLGEIATSLRVRGVRFVGRVEPASMPALYDEADIFLNASVVDNQPLSILEAFAAGTPVVSTGTGDISNMVQDGQTGLLIKRENPAAMADAVGWMFDHPDRALAMARRAHRQLGRHSWAGVREAWAAVYGVVRYHV